MNLKRLSALVRGQKGISAIGLSLGVSAGVAAVGLGLAMMIEAQRNTASRSNAKEIAVQLNNAGLQMTMKLISARSVVQEPAAGGGGMVWTSANTSGGDGWEFVPKTVAGAVVNPPQVIYSVCDPRFADPQVPSDLTRCPDDQVRTRVSFLPDRDGQHEVLVTTSVLVKRQGDRFLASGEVAEMETASTRALLSENFVECPTGLSVVGSPTVVAGSPFTLQVSNFTPSNATVTLTEGNLPFSGTDPKTIVLNAPTMNPGDPVQTLVYHATVSSGGATAQCAPVTVTVRPCIEYSSEDPVRELYRSLFVNLSSDVDPALMRSETLSLVRGDKGIIQMQNSLRASATYEARGAVPTTGRTASGDLGETLTNMFRVHLGRGGTASETAAFITPSRGLEYTRLNRANCLYSVAGSCSSYNGKQFPEVAADMRALPEFASPNGSVIHKDPIEELYTRTLGGGRADLHSTYQAKYDAHLNALKNGTKSFSTIEAELRADPAYGSRGGTSAESFTAMMRAVMGRKPMLTEINYYVALADTYGASRRYIAESLRSSDEFRGLGGCAVPQPAPACEIIASKDGVKPGETVTFTLRAYDRLTNVTWDGTNQSVSGNGVQIFQKDQIGGAAGTQLATTATIRNAGGTATCSVSVPVKASCSIVMHRRNGGPQSRWGPARFYNNSQWYPYYNAWAIHIPGRPASEFQWSTDSDYSNEYGWKYVGGVPSVNSGHFDPCNRNYSDPTGCSQYIKDMPAQWKNPADNVTYVLSTNNQGVPTPFYPSKGLCGSNDCRCWPGALISPLVVDLHDKGIKLNAITRFDVGEGKLPHFWPSNPDTAYFIALDKNEDGVIEDINEIFGNHTVGPDGKKAPGGFQALAKYDDNRDGFIDAKDAVFSQLKLWADKNIDGASSPDEIVALKGSGVKRIDLKFIDNDEPNDNYGNLSRERSVVELESGAMRKVFDIWFAPSGLPPDEEHNRELANAR